MNFSLPTNTPEGQKKAITADEKIITVGAGAGTGKTWVLSNRYLRLLIEDEKILPSNILTLTFTEAAAGDMKRRIEERIKTQLKDFNDDERTRKIIEGLSDSWISTIHSFARRLITESGLSLDIDPQASVITSQQEEDFWEGIKNAADFANLRELARTYGDKTLRDAAKFLDEDEYFSAGVSKWRAEKLADLARKVADLHSSSGNTWEKMLEWSENDSLIEQTRPIIKNLVKSEWLTVWRVWQNIVLPAAKKTNQAGVKLNEILEWQRENSPDDDEVLKKFYELIMFESIKANAYEPFKTAKNFLGMTFGDWRKTQSELIGKITMNYNNEISPEELRMRKTLLKFCAVSWGMWDLMKKRRGLLSFSDMIIHAKNAVSNEAVNKIFNHILVDEFQDTDPLQFDMIKSLIKPENNTSLFAVGDPKQSIYKFRHADPSLFAQTINDADIKIELDVSFRTRASLLRHINHIFKSLWREGLGKSDAMQSLKFESLDPAFNDSERDSGTMPDVKIILARHDKNTTEETRKILADNIAFYIASWVKEGKTIWDKAERVIRPVKFSDFAILSRSRSIYSTLEEALAKFNIPSVQDKSTDYFNRGEVNDIVCLLRAAANLNDDFSVAGWLISPFSGVNEDEALKNFFPLIDEHNRPIEIIKQNFPDAYSRLEYFSVIGENKGASGILEKLDENRKWLSCYKENDRLRVLRNLRHAVSIAGSFQQSGTSSLTACAEYLTRSVKNQIEYPEPKWHNENENAVKLGVVHSAKGLEYPVTVVFEYRVAKNSERNNLRPSKNLGLVFTDLPDEFDAEKQLADWEKLLSEQGDLEEEARLFYVAATRAQDSLIFCGLVNSKDDQPHENTWTKFLLDNISDDLVPVFAEKFNESVIQIVNHETEKKILTPVKLIPHKNFLRQFSASSYSLFKWCPFAWRRRYRQGLELNWEKPEKNFDFEDDNNNFSGGADLGSLAHWILSRWPVNDNYEIELEHYLNDREIISKLPGNLRKIWRNENSKISLRKWLMNFALSDWGIKLRHEKNIKREFHFRVRLKDCGTSLAGSMDAIYDNNIIDYKITSINDAPKELYEAQLDFYALAAHELMKFEIVNTCTAFLSDGKFIYRTCDNFDEIKANVLRASEICASKLCEPETKHCALCPFKKGCIHNKNAE